MPKVSRNINIEDGFLKVGPDATVIFDHSPRNLGEHASSEGLLASGIDEDEDEVEDLDDEYEDDDEEDEYEEDDEDDDEDEDEEDEEAEDYEDEIDEDDDEEDDEEEDHDLITGPKPPSVYKKI